MLDMVEAGREWLLAGVVLVEAGCGVERVLVVVADSLILELIVGVTVGDCVVIPGLAVVGIIFVVVGSGAVVG